MITTYGLDDFQFITEKRNIPISTEVKEIFYRVPKKKKQEKWWRKKKKQQLIVVLVFLNNSLLDSNNLL